MSNVYLLEKIGYVSQQPTQITSEVTKTKLTVKNTFAYDPDSKTAPDTAKRWAERSYWRNENKKPSEPIIKNNDPFTIQIISLESRAEGGRAYKVIDDQNRMFDLREDQVVEALALGGIQKGGKVNGEFVWGKNHSQTKLTYVGGKLHQEMILGLQKRKSDKTDKKGKPKKPYTSSKLVPGTIYSRKVYGHKQYTLFIGAGKFENYDIYNKKCYVFSDLWQFNQTFNPTSEYNQLAVLQKNVTPFEQEEMKISELALKTIRERMKLYTNGFSTLLNDFKSHYDNNINPLPEQYKNSSCEYHYYDIQHNHERRVEKWSDDFNQWFKDNFVWID